MRALEQLLGKDVVWLIYKHLHLYCTSEVVAEYHGRLGPGNIYCYIYVKYCQRKAYNYRFSIHTCGVNGWNYRGLLWDYKDIWNKDGRKVAPLPKNY